MFHKGYIQEARENMDEEGDYLCFPEDVSLSIPILPEAGQFHSSARMAPAERRAVKREAGLSRERRRELLPDPFRFFRLS
jgi:hypothetical protein